jgi:hypothetical protein
MRPTAPTPTPAPVAPAAVAKPEPWDEEEAYRARYQPGYKTAAQIAGIVNRAATDLARQGLWKSQIEKNEAQAAATRLLADPRARLMLSQAGYYDERTQTDVVLRDATLRQRLAAALNLEDLPGSRAADRRLRRDEGAANRASRERMADTRLQARDLQLAGRATDDERAQLRALEKVGWAHERDLLGETRVVRGTDELLAEEPGASEQQLAAARRVDAARQQHAALVAKIAARKSAVTAAPRTGTGAPSGGGSTPDYAGIASRIGGISPAGVEAIAGQLAAGTYKGYLGRLTPAQRQVAERVRKALGR